MFIANLQFLGFRPLRFVDSGCTPAFLVPQKRWGRKGFTKNAHYERVSLRETLLCFVTTIGS